MQIQLIAIGTKMPAWVQTGFNEYAKRLSGEWRLQLTEIPAAKRGKNADIARILQEEGRRMLAAIPSHSHILALDPNGRAINTKQFAEQLKKYQISTPHLSLLIGGPEGFSPEIISKIREKWSLSPLTFPHPLVRIIIAEQIYRAISLLRGHPYHRD